MEKGPWSPKLLIAVAVFFVVGAIGVYFAVDLILPGLIDDLRGPAKEEQVQVDDGLPKATVSITEDGRVRVEWQHLPNGTTQLRVYRSTNGRDWFLWKTSAIAGADGSLEFLAEDGIDPTLFQYYVEAVQVGGSTVWTSEIAPPVLIPDEDGNTYSGGGGTGGSGGDGGDGGGDDTPPPDNGDGGDGGDGGDDDPGDTGDGSDDGGDNGDGDNSTSTDTGGGDDEGPPFVTYYTPDAQISGTSSIPVITASFWTQHVNNTIEVGWQKIPAEVTSVEISRSEDQTGPWFTILRQGADGNQAPRTVRFFDFTLPDDYYYRLEGKDTSGEVVHMAGPLLLPGLPQ